MTFLSLGAVYTSLDLWFADKDLSYKNVKWNLRNAIRRGWYWFWWDSSAQFATAIAICFVLTTFYTIHFVADGDWSTSQNVPVWDKHSAKVTWIYASEYELPGEIGPPAPVKVKKHIEEEE